MAQKVITTIIDDIDKTPNAQPVLFSFNGQDYEIDLSSKNRATMIDSLSKFINHARPIRANRKRKNRAVNGVKITPLAHTPNGRIRSQDIRTWAKAQGISVRDRGRIPGHIVEQYRTREEPVTTKKGKTKRQTKA
jgi:hypothetical protein